MLQNATSEISNLHLNMAHVICPGRVDCRLVPPPVHSRLLGLRRNITTFLGCVGLKAERREMKNHVIAFAAFA